MVNSVGVSSRADWNQSQHHTRVPLNACQRNGFDGPSRSMNQMQMVNVSDESREMQKPTANESASPIEIIDSSDDESTTSSHGSKKPLHRSVGKSLGGGRMIKEEDPTVVKDEVVTNDDDIPMVVYEVNQEKNPSNGCSVDDTVNDESNPEEKQNSNAKIIDKNAEPVAGRNGSSSRSPTNNKTAKDNGNAVGAKRSSAQQTKRFKCQYCEYGNQYKCKLTVHMRIHTGETPYSCQYCEKRFAQKTHLQKHIATHKKRFPLRCPGCFSVFTRKVDEVEHEKTCMRRRYECYWCKKFVTYAPSKLKRHMRRHTGEKPFRCEICMQRFTQKGSLKTHLDDIHGK